jgi:hypothetical protein
MSLSDHDDLILALAEFSNDPLGFVLFAYPWGEPGELARHSGPEPWQRQLLMEIGQGVKSIECAIAEAQARQEDVDSFPILMGRTSGHGIGKSACVSWIIDWALSTLEDTKGVVTANTENQLKTKTWSEMAKWHRLSITKDLFRMTATARFSVDPDHEKTWRIDMVPWSEKNMEAFAGLHNQGKRILIVFDEASAIADAIWETTEGALTDKNTQIIWCAFGNPTRNAGRFRDCFEGGRFAHRWSTAAIDSREVSITNKEQIAAWIADYGEDHDFVRVRVRGMFPRTDATSFISLEMAREATKRPLPERNNAPVVLGVDVARYGDDSSVIFFRRGRDGRSIPPRVFKGLNTVQLATQVYNAAMEHNAVAIFVDGGGVGGGVVDQLNALGAAVYEVQFGGRADNASLEDHTKYLNKRAEIWGAMRTWLSGGCISDALPLYEHPFSEELSGPTYTYSREDYLQLEGKRDMRRRGLKSPDVSDALACTFAYPTLTVDVGFGRPETYSDPHPHAQQETSYA